MVVGLGDIYDVVDRQSRLCWEGGFERSPGFPTSVLASRPWLRVTGRVGELDSE